MPRKSARICKQQTSPFHMNTRRRGSKTPTADESPDVSDAPTGTVTPTVSTPDEVSPSTVSSSSLSELSTIPTESEIIHQPTTSKPSKKRKANELSPSPEANSPEQIASDLDATGVTSDESVVSAPPSTASASPVPAPERVLDDKYNPKLTSAEWKEQRYWPDFNKKQKIYYGADAKTRYKPGSQRPSQRDSPATGSPRRPARGGRAGRGRGGFGNGNGKGRPRGRGRVGKDDSPEPPRKRTLTEVEDEEVRILKARQLELKKVFNTIGAQQVEILDTLATRDINKLCRKPKAHKTVPEYDEVVSELEDTQAEVQDLVQQRYDFYIQQENERYAREVEVVETQFKQRCQQVQEEHLQGINGDITLLKKGHARDQDTDRTEAGSERDLMPFHHGLPESNTGARGYTSAAVQDDKSFRGYIESTDDHVRTDEETQQLLELIQATKKKRQEQFDKEKTMNMEALATEADHRVQMDEIGGYLIPRPLHPKDNAAYGLSALADVADFVAQQHPDKQYSYMPLSPGHQFPRNALNFEPLPGQRPLAPAPAAVPPPPTSFAPYPPTSSFAPPPIQSVVPPPPVQAVVPPPPPPQQTSQPSTPHSRQPSKQLQPPFQSSPGYEARPAPPGSFGPPPPHHIQYGSLPPMQTGHHPRPSLNLQTNMNGSHSRQSSLSTPATPQMVSTGPGQVIAPAPPKAMPSSMPPSPFRRPSDPPPYRQPQPSFPPMRPAPPTPTMHAFAPPSSPHGSLPPSPYWQPSPHQPLIHQQFIFQPPQQPAQHHPAPPPASLGSAWVPRYSVPASPNSNNPNISSITTIGAGMGHTGKIPVTFVNQTVQSRRNAAGVRRRGGGNARGKEGGGSGAGSRSGSEMGSEKGSRPGSAMGGKEGGSGNGGRRKKESLSSGAGLVRTLLPKA